jgi:Protein of unknown function (DUF1569)
MNSIYDKASNDAMIARINKLTPESKALWGKLTVSKMCKHCTLTIEVAFGKKKLKVNFLMRLLGKMLKKKVFYGKDMRKNSPTAKEFIVLEEFRLDYVKNELIENFSRFANEGKQSIRVMNHPFWGKMSHEDWDALMYKHIDHHLRQFGV